MSKNVIIGIDLAGKEKNPTGWALWQNKTIFVHEIYKNEEIIHRSVKWNPTIIAIDAPLNMPKKGIMRKADREMYKHGYPVFPPSFPAMEKLTLRAVKIKKQLTESGFNVIEVHPASTRKALQMPIKEWGKIQAIFEHMGLKGNWTKKSLTSHEVDAITATLTADLHLKEKTESIGEREEGYIIVPKKTDWRKLNL